MDSCFSLLFYLRCYKSLHCQVLPLFKSAIYIFLDCALKWFLYSFKDIKNVKGNTMPDFIWCNLGWLSSPVSFPFSLKDFIFPDLSSDLCQPLKFSGWHRSGSQSRKLWPYHHQAAESSHIARLCGLFFFQKKKGTHWFSSHIYGHSSHRCGVNKESVVDHLSDLRDVSHFCVLLSIKTKHSTVAQPPPAV